MTDIGATTPARHSCALTFTFALAGASPFPPIACGDPAEPNSLVCAFHSDSLRHITESGDTARVTVFAACNRSSTEYPTPDPALWSVASRCVTCSTPIGWTDGATGPAWRGAFDNERQGQKPRPHVHTPRSDDDPYRETLSPCTVDGCGQRLTYALYSQRPLWGAESMRSGASETGTSGRWLSLTDDWPNGEDGHVHIGTFPPVTP